LTTERITSKLEIKQIKSESKKACEAVLQQKLEAAKTAYQKEYA
jgi:hypothetical protein